MRKLIIFLLMTLISMNLISCTQPVQKQNISSEIVQAVEPDSKDTLKEIPAKQSDVVEEKKTEDIKTPKSFLKEANFNLSSDKIYYTGKAVVLTYHHFSLKPASGITIKPERFEADLKMLKDSNFNVISLKDMINTIQGNDKLPPNAVVIATDDGYESNYKIAYPILKKFNIPATIFIITSWIENYAPSDFEFNPMGPDQVKEMYKSGLIDIQSHSFKGHDYIERNEKGDMGGMLAFRMYDKKTGVYEADDLYTNRVINDLETSAKHIEKYTGSKPDIFAFPFGHYNTKLVELGKKAGFKYFVSTGYGYNSENSQSIIIKRIRSGDSKLTPDMLKENIINCGQGKSITP